MTFIDNHDTDRAGGNPYGTPPIVTRKYQAYTYILMRESGIPIVFWKDFYVSGMDHRLRKLLEARKTYAYGKGVETDTNDTHTYSYIREGAPEIPHSGLVMRFTRHTDGNVIEKRIGARKPRTTFYDYTGTITEQVTTDEDGFGEFKVKGSDADGYAVWVEA